MGTKCRQCMTRIPYGTLIATIMCCVGVGVFCGTMYRGMTLTLKMIGEVFHFQALWMEPVQLVFVILGASMGALGVMILFVGFLSTGPTRGQVYKGLKARAGGRITCVVFMVVTYLLELIWIAIFIFLIVALFMFTTFWALCKDPRLQNEGECIDFTQFHFFFPNGTTVDDMKVCNNDHEIRLFCKDYTENIEVMIILAAVACLLVILSLIHYLMCLTSNHTHIRYVEKLEDYQEMQCLNESELSTLPKERF